MKPKCYIHAALLLAAGVIYTSCIQINGSGYSDLTEQEKLCVKRCEAPIDSICNDGCLYQVTAEQVNEYLRQHGQVVVYEYLPFCPSTSGTPPTEVKRACDRRHMDLIVISSVYDGIFPIPRTQTFPIFVIATDVYHTDNYQTYSEQFYHTLTGSDDDARRSNSFHYFRNGRYVSSYSSI